MTEPASPVVVLGGGPAGVAAALVARMRGADVTVIERAHLGGTCVHGGCIPSAALHRAAHAKREIESAGRFGIRSSAPTTDWSALQTWVGSVVKVAASFAPFALEFNEIPVLATSARFVGSGRIEAGDRCFEGASVIIATGARAAPPALAGVPTRPPLTNDDIMGLDHTPSRVAILGAGRFSIEWADFLQAMGSKVTVVSDRPCILPTEDAELAEFVQLVLEERGVEFRLDTALESVDGDKVVTTDGALDADAIVCADERAPNTDGLGLDLAGVATSDDGAVIVDDRQQTTASSVFAAGDVTGPPWLTNRAMAEGMAAARNLFGEAIAVDHQRVPRAVNTDPALAAVGLTLDQATATGRPAGLRMCDLGLSPRAIAVGDPRGALKLVVDEETGEILGGHMIGPDATGVIAQVVLAMEAEVDFARLGTIFDIHPTMAEAVAQAVRFGAA